LASIHASVKVGARDIHPVNFLPPYLSGAAGVVYDTIVDNPVQREQFRITGPSHDNATFFQGSVLYLPTEPYGYKNRGLIRWKPQVGEDGTPGEPRAYLRNLSELRKGFYVPSFEEFGEADDQFGSKTMKRIVEAMRMGREVSMRKFLDHLSASLIHELDSTTAMNKLSVISILPGESLSTYAQRINELQQQADPDSTEASRTARIIAVLKSTVPSFVQKYSAIGGEFRISLESGIKTFKELTRRTAHFDAIESEVRQGEESAIRNAEQTTGRKMTARHKATFIQVLREEGEQRAIMDYVLNSQRVVPLRGSRNIVAQLGKADTRRRFVPYMDNPTLTKLGIPPEAYHNARNAERADRRATGEILRAKGERLKTLSPEEAKSAILKYGLGRTERTPNRKHGNGARGTPPSSNAAVATSSVPLFFIDALGIMEATADELNADQTLHDIDEIASVCSMQQREAKDSSIDYEVGPYSDGHTELYAIANQKKPNIHINIANRHMKVLIDSGCSLGAVMCSATAHGIRKHCPELVINDDRWAPERSSKTVLYGVDGRMRSFIAGTLTLRQRAKLANGQYLDFVVRYSILEFPRQPSRFRTIWGVPMILAHHLGFTMRDGTVVVTARETKSLKRCAMVSKEDGPPSKKKRSNTQHEPKSSSSNGTMLLSETDKIEKPHAVAMADQDASNEGTTIHNTSKAAVEGNSDASSDRDAESDYEVAEC